MKLSGILAAALLLIASPAYAVTNYVLAGQTSDGMFGYNECGKCQLYSFDTRTGTAIKIGSLGSDGDSAYFRYIVGSISYNPTLGQITLLGSTEKIARIDYSKTYIYTVSVITGKITGKVLWTSVLPGTTGTMISSTPGNFPWIGPRAGGH